MNISTRREQTDAVITVDGRIDAYSAEPLADAISRAAVDLEGDLILDLQAVEHVASAGLRVMLMANKTMATRPGSLKVVNVRPAVRRIFELCHLGANLGVQDRISLRIWGARGSLPSPLGSDAVEGKIVSALAQASTSDIGSLQAARQFVRTLPDLQRGTAGGNTSCVEVRMGDRIFILDAGSGLRPLGIALMASEFGQGKGHVRLLMSHTHWDHLMGLPFFIPGYVPGNRIQIYGGHENLEARFRAQQRPDFFPVELADMGASFEFHHLDVGEKHDLDGVTVSLLRMNHPGDSYSFRLDYHGKSIVYATDAEVHLTKEDPAQNYIDFFSEADVLVFDSQYTLEETVAKQDWGHSSPMIGADVAVEARVKKLLMFHHEPTASDEHLQASLDGAREYVQHIAEDSQCTVDLAREGMELDLSQ